MKLRALDVEEIEQFASRPNVKRIAVENWLISVDVNQTVEVALLNLARDQRVFGWNQATVDAIKDGIRAAAIK